MIIKRAFKDRISDSSFAYRKLIKSRLLKKRNCRVLMYHSIEYSNPEEDRIGLAVSPKAFYMHMKYLKENEFNVISLLELVNKITRQELIPEKSVVVTFDDGHKSVLANALPTLREFNFTASLFVNIYFLERKLPNNEYWHNWQPLNWEEIKKLHDSGLTIGSHGLTHRRLTKIAYEELKKEILESKELIEKNIGSKIFVFSYPHGSFNANVKKILEDNNFSCACSSIEGTNYTHTDIFALRRTEVNAFDDTFLKFEKIMLGSHDWLRFARSYD
jgi:peptidoglycan/xylan/chitin deacetylase (PgdA/CDA1 family)